MNNSRKEEIAYTTDAEPVPWKRIILLDRVHI
jgi:hypothetical protein